MPVSRVGDDDLGREALSLLVCRGLNIDAVSLDPDHPTGTVDARVDADGVATYVFPDDVAWDFLSLDQSGLTLAANADAVCFGSLAQRGETSRRSIHRFLAAAKKALKVFDINLRQEFYTPEVLAASLDAADVLKINDDELHIVTSLFDLPPGEQPALRALMERHALDLAVLTRGDKGSLLLSPDTVSDLPGEPVEVVDTIGPGIRSPPPWCSAISSSGPWTRSTATPPKSRPTSAPARGHARDAQGVAVGGVARLRRGW